MSLLEKAKSLHTRKITELSNLSKLLDENLDLVIGWAKREVNESQCAKVLDCKTNQVQSTMITTLRRNLLNGRLSLKELS